VPVDCADGDACTDDTCNEALAQCENTCSAAGAESPCCEDSACWEEAVCNEECIDEDGDGYGSPASINCPYSEEDCDDTDPNVNPSMTEIHGNGIDDDCQVDTPPWGTPSSVLGEEYTRSSDAVNYLLLVMAPAGIVLAWKRQRRRR